MGKKLLCLCTAFVIAFQCLMTNITFAADGYVIYEEHFDAGIGTLSANDKVKVEEDKNGGYAVLGPKGEVEYTPKGTDSGWDGSYSMSMKVKMKDWNASDSAMLIYRVKSTANDKTYIINYSGKGFNLAKMVPPVQYVSVLSAQGNVGADPYKWHTIRTDVINNDDSVTVRTFFDDIKQFEYVDTVNIYKEGGIVVNNNMSSGDIMIDDLTVTEIKTNKVIEDSNEATYDARGTEYEQKSIVLRELGIMGDYESGLFRGDYLMTRGEFLSGVLKMLRYDEIAGVSEQIYKDVDSSSAYYDAVYIASKLGFISGDGEYFYPDQVIAYNEACKILVAALGYEYDAQLKGGYPVGYEVVAKKLGLLDEISTDSTRGNLACMLFNALEVPIAEPVEFEYPDSFKIGEGKTPLELRNVLTGEDELVENSVTGLLFESTIGADSVRIGKQIFRCGKTNAAEYIGCKIKFYALEKNGAKTLLYAKPSEDIKVYEINYDDIAPSTVKTEFVYNDENDKRKSLKISPAADFLYNYKACPNITDVELRPKYGFVTLIDNNDDRIIDVVKVVSYDTFCVDYVTSVGESIRDKYENTMYYLGTKDGQICDIYKDNMPVDITKVKVNDVVNLAVSKDGMYTRAQVSSSKLVATVEESMDDEGKISVDGAWYEYTPDFSAVLDSIGMDIRLGNTYTFYLDVYGRIAAVQEGNRTNQQYGYLRKVRDDGTIDIIYKVEILTERGKWQVFELADTIKYNSEITYKAEQFITKGIICTTNSMGKIETSIPQMISYSLNSSGKINEIKTALPSGISEELSPDKLYKSYSSDGAWYKSTNKSFMSRYFVNSAVVFIVPKTNVDNDDFYMVTSCADLYNSHTYDVELYNVKNGSCDLVLIKDSNDNYGSSGVKNYQIMVVDNVVTLLDEYGNTRNALEGYYRGKRVTYILSDNISAGSFANGDIIRIRLNSNNEIIGFISNVKKADDDNYKIDGEHNANRMVYGRVTAMDVGARRVAINTDGSNEVNNDTVWADLSAASYIYCHYTRGNKNKGFVEVSGFDSMCLGDNIFVRLENEYAREAVIYQQK